MGVRLWEGMGRASREWVGGRGGFGRRTFRAEGAVGVEVSWGELGRGRELIRVWGGAGRLSGEDDVELSECSWRAPCAAFGRRGGSTWRGELERDLVWSGRLDFKCWSARRSREERSRETCDGSRVGLVEFKSLLPLDGMAACIPAYSAMRLRSCFETASGNQLLRVGLRVVEGSRAGKGSRGDSAETWGFPVICVLRGSHSDSFNF